jgi:hypothetical protein
MEANVHIQKNYEIKQIKLIKRKQLQLQKELQNRIIRLNNLCQM